jgi:YVTN family beta-propeller protein
VRAGTNPDAVAFDDENGELFVANAGSANLTIINGSTDRVLGVVTVGTDPAALAFDNANDRLYVANYKSFNVSVVNGSTGKVLDAVAVGNAPSGIAVDSVRGRVYVVNSFDGTVSVINATTDKVIGSVRVGTFYDGPAVAVDPATGYVYVTNAGLGGSDNVTVINGSTSKVVGTVAVGPSPVGIAVDTANGKVYVADAGSLGSSHNVTVIEASNDTVVATVTVGSGPNWVAVDPTNGEVDVTNGYSGNVTIINATTQTVVGSVTVGSAPVGEAFDTLNGCLYVANENSNNVSVVARALTVTATATPTTTDVGVPATFTARVSGGLPPLGSDSYDWTFGDNGTSVGTASTTSHDYVAPGLFQVGLTVTGPGNYTAFGKTVVSVNSPPIVFLPYGTKASADVGQSVTWIANASLGTLPYVAYSWTGLPPFCQGISTPRVTCTVYLPGTLSIAAMVTDSLGVKSVPGPFLTFVVYEDPSVNLTVNRSVLDVGQSVMFAANGTFGSESYTYDWSGLPDGCSAISARVNCTPTRAGSYSVTVNLSDSNGYAAYSNLVAVEVNPTLSASLPSATAGAVTGKNVTFTVTATGGTTPLSYVWDFGGGSNPNGASVNHTYTLPGRYVVTVWVNDSAGASTEQSLTVDVASSPPVITHPPELKAPTLLGLPLVEAYALVSGIIVVAAVASVVLWRRRQKVQPA